METEGGWHRLSRFSPQVGSKPSELRFPDGKIITMTNWGDFIAGVVEWLQVSGNLSDHDLPIQFGDQTQYVVSTTLPSRTGFDGSGVYRQVGEMARQNELHRRPTRPEREKNHRTRRPRPSRLRSETTGMNRLP